MTQGLALGLSLWVEVPCVLAVLRGPPWARVAAVAAAATLLTHPLVWHGVRGLAGWVEAFWVRAAVLELAAVGVEAALLAWALGVGWRALGASALANAASFGLGLLWMGWGSLG